MKYFLIIHYHTIEGKTSKRIGEYDSLEDAELEVKALEKYGFKKYVKGESGINNYFYYPPSSIIRYHIEMTS
ncbi:MAG: hypothetical protein WBF32_10660 [Candidatus Aminicenantaceae bacterium]